MEYRTTRPQATLSACRIRRLVAVALAVLAWLAVAPVPAQTGPAQVDRVIDGDTISVRRDGVRFAVWLTGVDTPETTHPTRGVEPSGRQAAADTTARLDLVPMHLRRLPAVRERERSREYDQVAPERPDGDVGQTREPRDPDRQPRVAPEVATSSQADQDAARRDREPSTQAFNRETASDRQRDSGPSR